MVPVPIFEFATLCIRTVHTTPTPEKSNRIILLELQLFVACHFTLNHASVCWGSRNYHISFEYLSTVLQVCGYFEYQVHFKHIKKQLNDISL
jgi:hypothetical protein